MNTKNDTTPIVQTIVSLAQNLKMDVTAEGVETGMQLDNLRALNCTSVQGNYFSTPVQREQAEQLIITSFLPSRP